MSRDQQNDVIAATITEISRRFADLDCEAMHFCLVVWCECIDRPIYMGGNDDDTQRVLKMLAGAMDGIASVHGIVEGHA